MGSRVCGFIRVFGILLVDGVFLQEFFQDWRVTIITLVCMLLYAFWLGEVFAPLRENAIRLDKLDSFSKEKLSSGYEILRKQYQKIYGTKLTLKVYLVPDDSRFNAYAFGWRKIAITSDALSSLDSYLTAGILSHELGHVIALDVCVKRLLLANLLGTFMVFALAQALWVCIVFLICIGIIWMLDSCFGFYIGIGIFKGMTKLGKGIFNIVVTVFQAVIALIDRRNEFAADAFGVSLGFGPQLSMVLDRYAGETAPAGSLRDILYATHPKTEKRIVRIEKQMAGR